MDGELAEEIEFHRALKQEEMEREGASPDDAAIASRRALGNVLLAREDARVAWNRLTELQPDASKRFIYGHSLGGAVAIDLAARLSKAAAQAGTAVPAHGLIVESSFTTLADIARAVTSPLLPVFLLSQKFDSLAKVHELRMPVLFVHGAGDSYVPSRFSQELYQAAPEPKKLLLVDGATHNNCMRVGSTEYLAAIHELFSLEAPAPIRQARGAKS